MSEQTTSNKAEIFLFIFLAMILIVVLFGEYILLGLLAIGLVITLWGSVSLLLWLWRFIGNTRHDWADRNQNRALQAATVQTQLFLECKKAELVYA